MTVQHYQLNQTPKIQLTVAAKNRLVKVIQQTEGAKAVRLSIKKSGCSGYAYDLKCVSEISSEDFIIELDGVYQLIIDVKSYPILEGLEIDYVKEGLQHKFIYRNPNQTGLCGCGESFSVR